MATPKIIYSISKLTLTTNLTLILNLVLALKFNIWGIYMDILPFCK